MNWKITKRIYLDYQEPDKLHNFEIMKMMKKHGMKTILILILNVQIMMQTLTVLIKEELFIFILEMRQ